MIQREEKWLASLNQRVAEMEFHRARFEAVKRMLFDAFRNRRSSEAIPEIARGMTTIRIDEVVGVIDRKGRMVRRLPPLRLSSARAWRLLFCRDAETYPALAVRSGPGGWYLTDAAGSLLYLDLTRAKGWRRVSVVTAPDQALTPAAEAAVADSECRCQAGQLAGTLTSTPSGRAYLGQPASKGSPGSSKSMTNGA